MKFKAFNEFRQSRCRAKSRKLFVEALESRRVLTGFPFAVGEIGWTIDTDSTGNVYHAGRAESSDDLDPGPATAQVAGGGTLTKYSSDGEFRWARSVGEHVMSVEVDAAGNSYAIAYFTGSTQVSGIDRLPGGSNSIYNGPTLTSHYYKVGQGSGRKAISQRVYQQDVAVLKFDTNGILQWSAQIGGNYGSAFANRIDIHLDNAGAVDGVFLTGRFSGTVDFDPGIGVQSRVSTGSNDAFILKLNGQGTFAWSATASTAGDDLGRGVAVAPDGSSYFTGYFSGSNPFGASFPMNAANTNDAFIAKLDSAGAIQWARTLTPDTAASTEVILVGQAVYVAGRSASGYGSIAKLDSNGILNWKKQLGEGGDAVAPWGVAADSTGSIYVYGYYGGDATVDFDPGSGVYLLANTSSDNGFIVKLDPEGNFGGWATRIGSHVRNAVYDGFSGTLVTTGHYSYANAGSVLINTRDSTGGSLPADGSGATWNGFIAKLSTSTGLPPGFARNEALFTKAGLAANLNEVQQVSFDASGSREPENDALTYPWNFGDGESQTTKLAAMDHAYAQSGLFENDDHLDDDSDGDGLPDALLSNLKSEFQ